MRRRAISLAALAIITAVATSACSDSGDLAAPTTTAEPGLLPEPSYTFGPTTTFMPDCAGMPTPTALSTVVGIPVDAGIVIGPGTCEFRGLNDQTRVVTLSLYTDALDQANFNDLLASVGPATPLNDPTVPGATIGPSNTIFVVTPAGIYTVVTAITDQPLDQQYALSVAVLAMWTAEAAG